MTDKHILDFVTMLKYPEVQEAINNMFESYLQNLGIERAISKAYTRLDLIEEHLGADEDHCIIRDLDYEEREPRIKVQDQFAAIINNSCQTTEVVMVAGNVTEIRARLLKEKITSGIREKERFMTSPQVALFLINDVPDEYKACSKSAASKAAFDVMKKALEMFPNDLKESKAKRRGAKVIEVKERLDYL